MGLSPVAPLGHDPVFLAIVLVLVVVVVPVLALLLVVVVLDWKSRLSDRIASGYIWPDIRRRNEHDDDDEDDDGGR
jgi:hypothetical protein